MFESSIDCDGMTMDLFNQAIEARRLYLNESTQQSVTACALDVLKSLKADTKLAKQKPDVTLEASENMRFGFTSQGGSKSPCIRYTSGHRFFVGDKERIKFMDNLNTKNASVFVWHRYKYRPKEKQVTYYIVSNSRAEALKWAKDKERKRIKSWRGLAKRAISALLAKTYSRQSDGMDTNQQITQTAIKNTSVQKSLSGGNIYSITITDGLRYAIDAFKGKMSSITTALQKASNKIISVINRKIDKKLGMKIDTPFPELRK